jgi:hypothetical protein
MTFGIRLRPHCSQAAIAIRCQCSWRAAARSPFWPRHRCCGEHRVHLGDAELDRLADGEVHALAGGHALDEDDAQRRLALDRAVAEHVDGYARALNRRDARGVLAAAAIEQNHFVAAAQAQHAHRVMRGFLGERAGRAFAQPAFDIEARCARRHIVAPRVQGANSSSP